MPDPLYRRIADDLLAKIEAGELGRDGRALPTELELREHYDASRNTVRDAVKWLISRGVAETRPGQGTFVVAKIDPLVTLVTPEAGFGGSEGAAYASEITARSRIGRVGTPRIEIQVSGAAVPELQLHETAQVISRHQERFVDETPWSLQTTFYPMGLIDRGAIRLIKPEDISGPRATVGYIEEAAGIKEVGVRDVITVRAPDTTEAAFFNLPDDGRVAVFETRRTGYDEHGSPLRLTVTTYPSDRNRFVMEIGTVPQEAPVPPDGRGPSPPHPPGTRSG